MSVKVVYGYGLARTDEVPAWCGESLDSALSPECCRRASLAHRRQDSADRADPEWVTQAEVKTPRRATTHWHLFFWMTRVRPRQEYARHRVCDSLMIVLTDRAKAKASTLRRLSAYARVVMSNHLSLSSHDAPGAPGAGPPHHQPAPARDA